MLIALLVAGAVLRLVVLITFRPALEYEQDSYNYLLNAQHLAPDVTRPLLYPLLLRGISVVGPLQVVPILQHIVALLAAVLFYVTLCRVGLRPWLGAVAVAPLLLDAYQADVEQFVMSETLFESLLLVGVACLLWGTGLSTRAAVGAGLALAAATLTRTIGLPLLAVALLLLVLSRVRWRRVLVFGLAAAVPLIGYAGWFASAHGQFGLQRYSGMMLAGRAMTIADCRRFSVPDVERPLCVPEPLSQRQSADWYTFWPDSPLRNLSVPTADYDAVAADFAHRVLLAQPADYGRLVGHDLMHYFAVTRQTGNGDDRVSDWQFAFHGIIVQDSVLQRLQDPYRSSLDLTRSDIGQSTAANVGWHGERQSPHIWHSGQVWLSRYQKVAYTWGPLLAVAAVLAVVAALGRLPAELRRSRRAALFLAASGVVLLLGTSATAVFGWRLVFPVIVLLPPAGAIGLELSLARLSARHTSQPVDAVNGAVGHR